MLPEELAREKIDKQLNRAGWDIVPRDEYVPNTTSAVKEALMKGNTESDYLLFVDNKAIANVVQTKDLTKVYKQGTAEVVANNRINLSISRGELVAILGKSGSGKTTLLNLIGGIDSPSSGKVLINGVDISSIKDSRFTRFRGKNIGYIFQNYRLIDELSVSDNIRVVQHINNWSYDEEYENSIINLLGIEGILNAKPSQLSGGQQQRVSIARALIGKPSIILADEPTGNLDNEKSKEIIGFFKKSNSEYGQTFIVVTHDLDIANQCNRIITIEDGEIVEDVRK